MFMHVCLCKYVNFWSFQLCFILLPPPPPPPPPHPHTAFIVLLSFSLSSFPSLSLFSRVFLSHLFLFLFFSPPTLSFFLFSPIPPPSLSLSLSFSSPNLERPQKMIGAHHQWKLARPLAHFLTHKIDCPSSLRTQQFFSLSVRCCGLMRHELKSTGLSW